MVEDRYRKILEISDILFKKVLQVPDKYYIKGFNYSINVLYKLAGYNCNLDGILRHIELKSKKSYIFRIPFIGKKINERLYSNKFKYEINLNKVQLEKLSSIKKYKYIFFATTNNYFNAFFQPINEIENKNDILIIIPADATKWINWKKINNLNIDVIFIENFLPNNFDNQLEEVSLKIENDYLENNSILKKYMIYNKVPFYSQNKNILQDFSKNIISFQIIFNKYLFEFLKKISSNSTKSFIARDRTAIQNSFVQVCNLLDIETNILVHGMISKDIEMNLWINGSYSNVKNVYVWGKHDKEVIENRQKKINEYIPKIIVGRYLPFKKIKKQSNRYILFVMQSEINVYIKDIIEFANTIKQEVLVRLHPGDNSLIKKYKKYQNDYFKIDMLDKPLEDRLRLAKVVIGYYSTSLLESMYNDIPTLFMNFKGLSFSANIFLSESGLSKKDIDLVSLHNISQLNGKFKAINDIKKINRVILKEFIEYVK